MSTNASTYTSAVSSDALTPGKLEEMMKALHRAPRSPGIFGDYRSTFGGIRIVELEADLRPVLRIRDEVPCTDDFRRRLNAQLLEMFGTRDHSRFARGSALMMQGVTLMRKEDVALLRVCTS